MQVIMPGFDPRLNADSGQCFRMREVEQRLFRVVAGGRCLHMRTLGQDCFQVDCSATQWAEHWRPYFDLDRDYQAIIALVPKEDRFLTAAAQFSAGLRIFRQDPWETLISFIISQRKTVPAIMNCVEALSRSFGTPLQAGVHAFPTPEQLAAQPMENLQACGLGYRSRYIAGTAAAVAAGSVDLAALCHADDAQLMAALTALPGVGVKVASCVALFGYHRLHHFPRDVWILRVEQEHYGGRFPEENYPQVAGVLQQYMFCFRRSPAYAFLQNSEPAPIHPQGGEIQKRC